MATAHFTLLPREDDRGPEFIRWIWATNMAGVFMVALRAYVRTKAKANGWDDFFIYLTVVRAL